MKKILLLLGLQLVNLVAWAQDADPLMRFNCSEPVSTVGKGQKQSVPAPAIAIIPGPSNGAPVNPGPGPVDPTPTCPGVINVNMHFMLPANPNDPFF